jgi:hypothetical protein
MGRGREGIRSQGGLTRACSSAAIKCGGRLWRHAGGERGRDLLSADGWNYSEMINACLSLREARAIPIRRRAPHARRGAAKIALS